MCQHQFPKLLFKSTFGVSCINLHLILRTNTHWFFSTSVVFRLGQVNNYDRQKMAQRSVPVASCLNWIIYAIQGVEPATTYENLGLPPDWYGALEWVFPHWARKHALDKGEAVNILKGAIVTADRIITVSQVLLLFLGNLDTLLVYCCYRLSLAFLIHYLFGRSVFTVFLENTSKASLT